MGTVSARRVALLVLLATSLIAPAGAAGAPRTDVRAFAKATLAFDLARGKAVGRAERLGDQRRSDAKACLDVVRAAPARRHDELYTLYFTWVSAGYFTEDEPIFARWSSALRRITTRDRSLRSARDSIGRQLTRARSVHGQGQAFCEPVAAWAAGSWKASATPPAVLRLGELAAAGSAPVAGITATARLLKSSGGRGGSLAADVVRDGVDEPDESIVKAGDPFVALLAPTG